MCARKQRVSHSTRRRIEVSPFQLTRSVRFQQLTELQMYQSKFDRVATTGVNATCTFSYFYEI